MVFYGKALRDGGLAEAACELLVNGNIGIGNTAAEAADEMVVRSLCGFEEAELAA